MALTLAAIWTALVTASFIISTTTSIPVSLKSAGDACKPAPKPLANSLRMSWELLDTTMATMLSADPDNTEVTVCTTDIALQDMTTLGKVMGDAFREIKCLYFSAIYVEVEVINDMQLYVKEILEKQAVCVPDVDIPTFDYQCNLSTYTGRTVAEVRRAALEQMAVMSEVIERMYMTLALEKAGDQIFA